MSFNAGEVIALLGFRVNPAGLAQYEAGLNKATAAASRAEKATAGSAVASSRAAKSMGVLGTVAKTGAAAGLAAVAAGAIYSVKKSMDLQKALAEVQAVTRAGPKAMAAYKKAAIELGTSTGVGATQAAGALAELAKGGLSVDDTLTALKGTIALAQAGGMDLATAGETVAQSLNLFAMKGSEATKVADSFANAANATTADVAFFSQGMAQGGAAAKAAGLDFDQTTVALEMLAANGFTSGSDAGTSLKTTFNQITKPTKQAKEEMQKLGLEFYKSNGSIKSVAAMSGMLRDKLGGLTKQQRLAAASTIAGTDGMRALLALYDQGSAKALKFGKANGESGTAARTAADKTNNLEGNLEKLEAQFDALAISAGDELVPALTDATKQATKFVDGMRTGKGDGGDFAKTVEDISGGLKSFADSPVLGAVWEQLSAKMGGTGAAVLGVGRMLEGVFTLDPSRLLDGLVQVGDGIEKQITTPAKTAVSALKNVVAPPDKPVGKNVNTQNQNLDLAAAGARDHGVSQVKIEAVLYGDNLVRTKLAGLRALAQGVPAVHVKTILSGDSGAKMKIAALGALARNVPYAVVTAVMKGDQNAKVKLAALKALTQGVPSVVVSTILSGDNRAKVKIAALAAAAAGVPSAAITATLHGDNSVRAKLAALAALSAGVKPATVKAILTGDGNAKSKIAALNAARLDPKTVPIGAQDNATGVISGVRSSLGSLPGSKTITITTVHNDVHTSSGSGGKGHAAGRAPSGAETALTGEGGGHEYIGNEQKGFMRVDQPTLVALQRDDYVIPTEGQYANNAMRFLKQMYGAQAAEVAHEMGVSGYASGTAAKQKSTAKKAPAKKPSEAAAAKDQALWTTRKSKLPGHLDALGSPANELDTRSNGLRSAYDERKSRVSSLEGAKNQSEKDKNGHSHLTADAKNARKDLPKAKREMAKARTAWQRALSDSREAKRYAGLIAKEETRADTAADLMSNAVGKKDDKAWAKAKDQRNAALSKLRDLLQAAFGHAPKNSQWYLDLQNRVGKTTNDLQDLGADTVMGDEPQEEKDKEPTTYTDAELKQLDEFDAADALAGLTESKDDDIAAAQSREGWLSNLLAGVQGTGGAGRGGASAIAKIATDLKSTRDELKELSKPPDVTADMQAGIDQANARTRAAEESARINAQALAAFSGSGDIGTGGANAYQAAGGVTVNFNSTLGPTPQQARQAADVVVSGLGSQPVTTSPRVSV